MYKYALMGVFFAVVVFFAINRINLNFSKSESLIDWKDIAKQKIKYNEGNNSYRIYKEILPNNESIFVLPYGILITPHVKNRLRGLGFNEELQDRLPISKHICDAIFELEFNDRLVYLNTYPEFKELSGMAKVAISDLHWVANIVGGWPEFTHALETKNHEGMILSIIHSKAYNDENRRLKNNPHAMTRWKLAVNILKQEFKVDFDL